MSTEDGQEWGGYIEPPADETAPYPGSDPTPAVP